MQKYFRHQDDMSGEQPQSVHPQDITDQVENMWEDRTELVLQHDFTVKVEHLQEGFNLQKESLNEAENTPSKLGHFD